jgi:methylmalonyl-CoA mutase, N-terminal domain
LRCTPHPDSREAFTGVDIAGGVSYYFVGEIAEASYRFQREVDAGQRIIVGVNAFTEGNEDSEQNLLRIDPGVEDLQRKRLAAVKADRDDAAVAAALDRVRADAADPGTNLMPAFIDAVGTYATLEEVVEALESVFGRYREPVVI